MSNREDIIGTSLAHSEKYRWIFRPTNSDNVSPKLTWALMPIEKLDPTQDDFTQLKHGTDVNCLIFREISYEEALWIAIVLKRKTTELSNELSEESSIALLEFLSEPFLTIRIRGNPDRLIKRLMSKEFFVESLKKTFLNHLNVKTDYITNDFIVKSVDTGCREYVHLSIYIQGLHIDIYLGTDGYVYGETGKILSVVPPRTDSLSPAEFRCCQLYVFYHHSHKHKDNLNFYQMLEDIIKIVAEESQPKVA